jgi:hypothetical protein
MSDTNRTYPPGRDNDQWSDKDPVPHPGDGVSQGQRMPPFPHRGPVDHENDAPPP